MANRKTTLYWLLLAALLPAIFLMLVGDTYARYDTTIRWNTVISPSTGQQIKAPDYPVLSKAGDALTFTLSEEIAAQEGVTYALESLSQDGTYALFETESLTVSTAEKTATVTLTDATPPPGTYRLTATWTIAATEATEETTHTATATFFINYSDTKTQEVTE